MGLRAQGPGLSTSQLERRDAGSIHYLREGLTIRRAPADNLDAADSWTSTPTPASPYAQQDVSLSAITKDCAQIEYVVAWLSIHSGWTGSCAGGPDRLSGWPDAAQEGWSPEGDSHRPASPVGHPAASSRDRDTEADLAATPKISIRDLASTGQVLRTILPSSGFGRTLEVRGGLG